MGARTDIRVRGVFRLKLGVEKDGKQVVVHDSGWNKNTVTNEGLDDYIAGSCGGATGSKVFTHLVLATQTNTVNATQTAMSGETRVRAALDASTVATGTFRATASWSSDANTAAVTIGGLGMYNTSAAGTLGAGNTFATSQWASNQNISATYELRFS